MPPLNPKNSPVVSPIFADLGIEALLNPDAVDEQERKKRMQLAQQRQGMDGKAGVSPLFGNAATDIFGQL